LLSGADWHNYTLDGRFRASALAARGEISGKFVSGETGAFG
jgi:hypothetical protein